MRKSIDIDTYLDAVKDREKCPCKMHHHRAVSIFNNLPIDCGRQNPYSVFDWKGDGPAYFIQDEDGNPVHSYTPETFRFASKYTKFLTTVRDVVEATRHANFLMAMMERETSE